jgi:hypothetical protein
MDLVARKRKSDGKPCSDDVSFAFDFVLEPLIDQLEISPLFFHRYKAIALNTGCDELKYAILFKTLLDKTFYYKDNRFFSMTPERVKQIAGRDVLDEHDDFMRKTKTFFRETARELKRDACRFYEQGRLPLTYFDSECLLLVLRYRADEILMKKKGLK